MSTPIEDYALLADLHTGPLVSRTGSIDWLCLPRFDSPAVFCALLGDENDGRWSLSIEDGQVVSRAYVEDTFVLRTVWRGPVGEAIVTDFLPSNDGRADVVRMVECTRGRVTLRHDLRIRFDYARSTAWLREVQCPGGEPGLLAVAGPDAVLVSGPGLGDATFASPGAEGARVPSITGTIDLIAGRSVAWDLTWFPSHRALPRPLDAGAALQSSIWFWQDWAARIETRGDHEPHVRRSLLVLRALTHAETGGIVAAPTTSLPESWGGERNWDYRYTWLRDASMTIEALLSHGLTESATLWRRWLLRAVAGDSERLQIMYGLAGERRLPEIELDHLAGYEGSVPVRIGNGAVDQYQADVAGEVMLALAATRDAGIAEDATSWGLQKELLRFCTDNLDRPDHGIWEMRGDQHFFTHGRVMLWSAFDQGIRAVEEHGLDGPVGQWRATRARLRAEIEDRGFEEHLQSFTQTYDSAEVDASLLVLPQTGFLAYDDPRMLGTVARIEEQLVDRHGLVHRYRTDSAMDGLSGGEFPFLICSFWLVEQYARSGRRADALALMRQLCGYANDLGLLSEEYDPDTGRLAGNFPQAFSHLALIRASDALFGSVDAVFGASRARSSPRARGVSERPEGATGERNGGGIAVARLLAPEGPQPSL